MIATNYVLIDRDGVINQDSDDYIKSPEEWLPISGSLEAIALLNHKGYKVTVITNQSGLGRGLFDLDTLTRIHAKMRRMTKQKGGAIDSIFYCPHRPEDHCVCRKPKPGLLERFSREKNIALDNIYFIGDTLKDIRAGQAVNALPLLVKTGKGLRTLSENPKLDVPVFEDLYDAAKYVLSN